MEERIEGDSALAGMETDTVSAETDPALTDSVTKGKESLGISLRQAIADSLGLANPDPKAYSPLSLAYIGDGIYELIIRTILMSKGNLPANKLHRAAIGYVSAPAQAAMMERIRERLTPEETAVFNRGRNASPKTPAKHASLADYHLATGFEALMGYLYITDRMERLLELVALGMDI